MVERKLLRNILSKGGSLYSRIILNIPIKDLTGGFNLWKKNLLERINIDSLLSKGYFFQIELKYRAYRLGFKIHEMPIIFEERKKGISKISKKIFFEAMLKIWKLKFLNFNNLKNKIMKLLTIKFIKFGIVGSLGTIINIILFYLFVDILGFNKFIIATINFLICVTQNYLLNHIWPFNEMMKNDKLSFSKYIKFILTSLIGYIINISVLKIIPMFIEFPFHAIT